MDEQPGGSLLDWPAWRVSGRWAVRVHGRTVVSMPPITVIRPPTEEEARLLSMPLPKFFGWWTSLVSGLCIFVLTFLLVLLASPILPVPAILPLAIAAGLSVFLAWVVYVQRRERQSHGRMQSGRTHEAAAGHVRSTTYTIRDAVAVEEQEDEGLSFYLLPDDGRTLFLSGQYLYEPVEGGFPWTSFELVQAPVAGDPARRFTWPFAQAEPDTRSVHRRGIQVWSDPGRWNHC
jgi:hypothetical protein